MLEPHNRFRVLDGWRGISILLVMATHLIWLGPKSWQLNLTAGPMGMALFFTLSGFLITNFLLHNSSVTDFLIRRIARIIPLAWLFLIIVLPITDASPESWRAHMLFYANWPPMQTGSITSHFWSLCIEMQFYFGVALLFLIFKKRGLLLLPALCIAFTLFRVINGVHIGVATYFRIDEILAGATLALVYNDKLGRSFKNVITKFNPWLLLLLFFVSSHPASEFLNYFRPYLASLLVGWTLLNENSRLSIWLHNRTLAYIGAISYALYVIHPVFIQTWLGSGDGWSKYAKRPLYFAVTFLLAHLSTFYYENRCIALGKRISEKIRGQSASPGDKVGRGPKER